MPYAAMGIVLSKFKYSMYDKSGGLANLVCLIIFAVMRFLIPTCNGFGYGGLGLFFVSCALVIFTISIPNEIFPDVVRKVIFKCSRYTMGIYFMHIFIGELFQKILFIGHGILLSGLIFVCSMFVAVIFDKVFEKNFLG